MLTFLLLQSCGLLTGNQDKEFPVTTPNQPENSILPLVDAVVDSYGVVTCADPQKRISRPMYPATFGREWNNQPEEGYLGDEFWAGGEGIVVDDLNEDGLLDIFVPTLDHNLLFFQQSDGSFDERSEMNLPMVDPIRTVGASVADFDGDDDLDLFLLNLVTPHQFFENIGDGQFIDRSEDIGIIQDPYDVHYTPGSTWGDPDNDGDLDLLVLTSGTGPVGPPPWEDGELFEEAGENRMYMNESGAGFLLGSLPNHDPEPYSCCAAFVDVNLDFREDLYIVNDFGMYVEPNQLLYADENFEMVPDIGSGIDMGMYGMGLAVGAFNDDEYPDFAVSDWKRNWLFLSDGFGDWYDATQQYGFVSQHPDQHIGWGVEFPDVDNDGDLDIWVGFGHLGLEDEIQVGFEQEGYFDPRYQPDSLYLQEDGQLVDVAEIWGINFDGVTRGGVWADLNNDGFLDLVVAAIDGPVKAYLANCDDSSWIRIQLRQPDTLNTRAVGARIKVTTKQGQQLRWILAGTSLSSSSPLEAHFGLGGVKLIREIEIIWPDETMTVLKDLDVNQTIRVTRE